MPWIHPLSTDVGEPARSIGAKAHGLIALLRLGLPVPPGFVIDTAACRAFLAEGRFPDGLDDELAAAVRSVGRGTAVSVRSGAAVSMPGMMNTVLNVDGPIAPVVRDVFASWDTPRARTYRELHDIPHELGTAVVVQAMVFGDRDDHSGAGVAFSRDPQTGERTPFGEVLFGHHGEDVVSGRFATLPLAEVAAREPGAWAALVAALDRVEAHHRDACHVEFTIEAGRLWLLQVRTGGLAGRAAVRVAVDLVDEGAIDRREAVRRVSARQLAEARVPRIVAREILGRGIGACAGVATGRVATTADDAVRMAVAGPVVLVRPETSPLDLHGMAAAAGIVTARGGPTSHAAVVARSMGKPAVVGASGLAAVPEGTLVTIDGVSGEVVLGRARVVSGVADPHLRRLLGWVAELRG